MRALRCSIVGVAFALLPRVAAATTLYVDFTVGDNARGDGSALRPWKECPGTQGPVGADTSGWRRIPVGSTVAFTSGQVWPRPVAVNPDWFDRPAREEERIVLTASVPGVASRAVFDLSGVTAEPFGF